MQIRRFRRLVGGVDAAEAGDLAGARAPVEALGISRLTDRERGVDEHLEEAVGGQALAHAGPILAVGADRGHEDDEAGVLQEARCLAEAPHVFGALLRREAEISAQAEAEVVAVEDVAVVAAGVEQGVDPRGDRALAGAREAGEPDDDAALTEPPRALLGADGGVMPANVGRDLVQANCTYDTPEGPRPGPIGRGWRRRTRAGELDADRPTGNLRPRLAGPEAGKTGIAGRAGAVFRAANLGSAG